MNSIKFTQQPKFMKAAFGVLVLCSVFNDIQSLNLGILFFIKVGIVLYTLAYTKVYEFSGPNDYKIIHRIFGLELFRSSLNFPRPDYVSIFSPNGETKYFIKLFKGNKHLEIHKDSNYNQVLSKAKFLSDLLEVELYNPIDNNG